MLLIGTTVYNEASTDEVVRQQGPAAIKHVNIRGDVAVSGELQMAAADWDEPLVSIKSWRSSRL